MTVSTVVVTGSIANDYLMDFPGRIREQLVDGQLDHISLSFLVDELQINRGGIGANIAFGLGKLGHRPYVVGAVGQDFADYRQFLEGHGVDTSHVRVSTTRHTARFLCTTDADHNQIATFYAGAMAEAREIDLAEVVEAIGAVDLVMISPDDPVAMLRHTRTARALGLPFAADPSQQLARMEGPEVRQLVDGAQWLFTNQYERDLLLQKTGWSEQGVLESVGSWVVTLGDQGLRVHTAGEPTVSVPAHAGLRPVDPTGVGDALRSGFVAALAKGLDVTSAAQVGCTVASFALETVGTQEYSFTPGEFLGRVTGTYGEEAAARVESLFEDLVDAVPAVAGGRAR
jgi:adenosine kinase